jgi:hypothetical protein
MNCRQAGEGKRRACRPGSAVSATATLPVDAATSTHEPLAMLRLDLRQFSSRMSEFVDVMRSPCVGFSGILSLACYFGKLIVLNLPVRL